MTIAPRVMICAGSTARGRCELPGVVSSEHCTGDVSGERPKADNRHAMGLLRRPEGCDLELGRLRPLEPSVLDIVFQCAQTVELQRGWPNE